MKRLCCLLLLFLLPIFASAEEFFLEVPDIKGFTPNEITVHSPVSGQLTLSVVAGTNTFFTWTADVLRGKNTIGWNGLGYHNEVIPEGTYRMIMAAADGSAKCSWRAQAVQSLRNIITTTIPVKYSEQNRIKSSPAP